MGVNSDAPATPFKALPAPTGMLGSGITIGQNPNIRGIANSAAQNVATRQKRFMDLVHSTAPTNNGYDNEINELAHKGAAVDEDYIKAGSLLVDRRDEVDAFIDWVLFG